MSDAIQHPSSFRDPAGFVFRFNGLYYRQVNQAYAIHYDLLISSGLYRKLIEKKWMIPHEEVSENFSGVEGCYKTLLPEQLPFISYPYEWCFDQLKDAALLTLKIQTLAVEHGMILKDATPFNIQFLKGKPVFIDALSFERYNPAKPWIAYRQFCEGFLFPLYLGHYLKTGLQKILSSWPDGISVQMTAAMLPWRSRFNLGVWMHVHLQNKMSGKSEKESPENIRFNKEKMVRLTAHLQSELKRLRLRQDSSWSDYYDKTILSNDYLSGKERIFRNMLEGIDPGKSLDLGCNDGYFSRILAEKKFSVVSSDLDETCISNLYRMVKNEKIDAILPLVVDLANPTAAIGFANRERASFLQRVEAGLVVALALVHHLVLTNNIPFSSLASQFAELTDEFLIVEFVPAADEKASQLIRRKETFHQPYDEDAFEASFGHYFLILQKELIPASSRSLYLMKKK